MTPVASDGFILNYVDTLLQLCKPFVGNFAKYGTFIGKINCFYLATNDQIDKATSQEKVMADDALQQGILAKNKQSLSGVTTNPFVESSSLMGGSAEKSIAAPNFVSDCFFLAHIGISFMTKKIEQFYMKNNEEMNKAIGEKDY